MIFGNWNDINVRLFFSMQRAAEKIIGQAVKAECRVAIMVAVMILAFLMAWTPYSVLALLIAFGGVRVSPAVSIIPALCAKSSICWNPIIYIGLNTQVKSCRRVRQIDSHTPRVGQTAASDRTLFVRLSDGVCFIFFISFLRKSLESLFRGDRFSKALRNLVFISTNQCRGNCLSKTKSRVSVIS